MANKHYRYLFGPVHSRRLGRSLGIDLLDSRRCSYNCIFCEVGATDLLTTERGEYVPTTAVIDELRAWVENGGAADVVTLAGSGEPTLHSRFGDIIDAIHAYTPLPAILLTNSSLLWDTDVREAAARADMVKVSLSAWNDDSLCRLNRPTPGITYARLIEGLHAFCDCYKGILSVEVMLVKGINDTPEQVAMIAREVSALSPDNVQLNTVVRPAPTGEVAVAVDYDSLLQHAKLFSPKATVIPPHGTDPEGQKRQLAHIEELKWLLARRRT
jgi:wyosine [tRNA(Phe)-imidazoG37] synthetase (radical SAM superfamily)